jgi:SAM-dependent methyltransferase
MSTASTVAHEDIKPIPVRVKSGLVGSLQFALRRSVDLQLFTIWQVLGGHLPQLRGSLLDVGCGEMPFRSALHPEVRYTGLDVDEAVSFGMDENDSIQTFDGRSIPFADNSFDNVLCTEVLEHAEEPEILVAEIFRVLKPGGTFIMTVPFAARVHHAPYDFQRFTRYKLDAMLSGYSEVELAPRGNDIAVIANMLIVLAIRLLRPSLHLIWSLPLACVVAPLAGVFLFAAHLTMAIGKGSIDCPLGYSVVAKK